MTLFAKSENFFANIDFYSPLILNSSYYPTDILPSCLVLWHWGQPVKVVKAKDFLIFKLVHEFSDDFCLSVAGDVGNTAKLIEVLNLSRNEKLTIRYLPLSSEQKKLLEEQGFTVSRDESMDDYIFSTESLATFPGREYGTKRRYCRKFVSLYENILGVEYIPGLLINNLQEILSLHNEWEQFGTDGSALSEDEKNSIKNMKQILQFKPSNFGPFYTILIRVRGRLAGFVLLEQVSHSMAVCHFLKTNLNLTGITEFTFQTIGRFLSGKNIQHLNHLNDVGIAGLRQSKISYKPINTEKKYVIKYKDQ